MPQGQNFYPANLFSLIFYLLLEYNLRVFLPGNFNVRFLQIINPFRHLRYSSKEYFFLKLSFQLLMQTCLVVGQYITTIRKDCQPATLILPECSLADIKI